MVGHDALDDAERRVEGYTVGVDFGTLSGRAVVVRVRDGAEIGSAVTEYPHAVLDRELPSGVPLGADWALQHPEDYREVLRTAVPEAVRRAGIRPDEVIGIATDFTACTVLPVLTDGTPLCLLPEFADRPHAWVKLWKHHAAQPQADAINAAARDRGETWLPRYGGLISSEWTFAKALQILVEDPEIYARMDHFVEAADWIVWQLGGRLVRNVGCAGYKAIRQDGRYPSEEFCAALDPRFARFCAEKLSGPIGQFGTRAGSLTAEAAGWTGLPAGIAVAVGNVDAHVTAPAVRATGPGAMVAIMGTSTCLVMNSEGLHEVPGMCGVVEGGIVAGQWGYEAGQSGVGDIFAWFTTTAVPTEYAEAAAARGLSLHEYLTELAAGQRVGQHGLLALDWHSGNRSVLVDHALSGLIIGQTLATRPEDVYRALIEATAFGARYIVDTFVSAGVPVSEFIVAGGLTKNQLLMQIYADVLDLPIGLAGSEQAPALGSAIHAAVAAGVYLDVEAAAQAMGSVRPAAVTPVPEQAAAYAELYADYRRLYDFFGRPAPDGGTSGRPIMHALRERRRATLAQG